MDSRENTLINDLETQGYSLLHDLNSQGISLQESSSASSWKTLLKNNQNNLSSFLNSWNNLPADEFLRDGGHYRQRRYSVFNWEIAQSQLELLPHEPHFQSTYRNSMNGGINRDFEAFEKHTLDNPVLLELVQFVTQHISLKNEKQWRIQAHQFRIEANNTEAGLPTPEGIHRDGADFILIMLLKRNNIRGGVNHIYDDAKRLVFGGILENLGDAVIIDDRKVWHGVSEVYPDDESQESYRDVLVLTFHNKTMS